MPWACSLLDLQRIDQRSIQIAVSLQSRHSAACADFDDGGRALIESVRDGRGPRGFHLDSFCFAGPFETVEKAESFLDAVGSPNCHLEQLELTLHGCEMEPTPLLRALSNSLQRNTTLVNLHLSEIEEMDEACFRQLLRSISTHQSLQMEQLENVDMKVSISSSD